MIIASAETEGGGGGGGATVVVVTVRVALAELPGPLGRDICELIVFVPLAVEGGVTDTLTDFV